MSCLLACASVPVAAALQHVTLQLRWTPAFQYAGYYAALEQGYYREAGLDVDIQQAIPGTEPLVAVTAGAAQYGVGNSSLLLARHAGKRVVVLAVIQQHSPASLLVRDDHGIQEVHDLVGKRVMLDAQSDEILAYLKRERVPLDRLRRVEHSHRVQDLVSRRVDAMSASLAVEPYELERLGQRYLSFTPRLAGIDFYGDNLFTTEAEIARHPDRVKAFREASLRGWQYAVDHPEEMADLIVRRYAPRMSRNALLFEANHMGALMRPDLVDIGYMNAGRWRHIADVYAELGLLPEEFEPGDFLYQPSARPRAPWLLAALAVLAVVTASLVYVQRLRRRLARAHQALRDLAWRDALTGLSVYAPLAAQLRQILAQQDAGMQALLVIGVDGLRAINDSHGHAAGDQVLQELARRLQAVLRDTDRVARLGGDQFVVLLQPIDAVAAWQVAEALRTQLGQPMRVAGQEMAVSCSVGVALAPAHGADETSLLAHASAAMYRAKTGGGKRVQQWSESA